jgi:hypothetical protein
MKSSNAGTPPHSTADLTQPAVGGGTERAPGGTEYVWSAVEGLTLPGSSVVVLLLPFAYSSAHGHVVSLSLSGGGGGGEGVAAGRLTDGGENTFVGELLRGSLVFVPT